MTAANDLAMGMLAEGDADGANSVHELMLLAQEGSEPATLANKGANIQWNHHAQARMNWGNVAHIVETLSRNGAEKEVRQVLANPANRQYLD